MSKIILAAFTLPLLLLFAPADIHSGNSPANKSPATHGQDGTLQKMIVASGSVTMDLDLNRINGMSSTTGKLETLHFAVAPNSFFPVLVFNNVIRGPEPGSMGLVPQNSVALPTVLTASLKRLAIEKLHRSEPFDMAVRDAMSGFVFFNVEGNLYDYDASAQLLGINGGRLLMSKEFASALGRRADAGLVVGKISVQTAMQPIEITQLVNGAPKSVVMPPLRGAAGDEAPTLVQGPDVIVGDLPEMAQFGSAGTQVGLGIGTTSCNNGNQPIDWFALPNTDHPVIPQNFYRMSGGANNNERFEQVGQSWMKHAFLALEDNACGFGCNTSGCTTGSHLCPGCSDPYGSGLNADQNSIGSRAWVNPFTGVFPSNADDHNGHSHNGVSHRVLVEANDLNTTMNQGATYFAEAQYVTPHEYAWCQAHPGECNMFNNASYRQFSVTGTTSFTFSPLGSTVRMQSAIEAWAGTGATVTQIQPDPGNDGVWFMGYKVTNPTTGVWHYEYALYNQNLDRAIQSFSVPLGTGVNVSNIGFHAPPQHPGWLNDGTQNNAGYSSTSWTPTQTADSLTWATDTFAQNQNANAIRWGTLYNFRFDSDQAPHTTSAMVSFFKTGSPVLVLIQAPVLADATPTPTPTASPSVTPTPTPTPTPTATATPCDTGLIQNEGFETGSFPPWVIDGNNATPVVTNTQAHSGTFSGFAGDAPDGFCGFPGGEALGDSSFYQQFTVPAGTSTLSFWHWDCTTDSITFDWQDAYITDSSGNILQTIFHQCLDGETWINQQVDMTPFAGQTVRIKFLVHEDAFGDLTGMYVDDVVLYQPCGTPSPTPTATATATATPTAAATATATATATPTATATATATATPTATATATPTPTPTSTPRPTPTPRSQPTPRGRPTPPPRP